MLCGFPRELEGFWCEGVKNHHVLGLKTAKKLGKWLGKNMVFYPVSFLYALPFLKMVST